MSDLEVASEPLEISGKLLAEVAAAIRRMSYEEKEKRERGKEEKTWPHHLMHL